MPHLMLMTSPEAGIILCPLDGPTPALMQALNERIITEDRKLAAMRILALEAKAGHSATPAHVLGRFMNNWMGHMGLLTVE